MLRKNMDDLSSGFDSTQLHLFLSIIILMLLLKLFSSAPELFDIALFSNISLPPTYALTYYTTRYTRLTKFVIRKNEMKEEPNIWMYELTAIIMSFIMGYIVFIALSGSSDLIIFTLSFIVVQIMRFMILSISKYLTRIGIDIQNPVIVILVSLTTSAIGLIGITFFLMLLYF